VHGCAAQRSWHALASVQGACQQKQRDAAVKTDSDNKQCATQGK